MRRPLFEDLPHGALARRHLLGHLNKWPPHGFRLNPRDQSLGHPPLRIHRGQILIKRLTANLTP
jgi:hypothetical protein